MVTYYGYTISPNQIETGEGFLICKNVPIARTGVQEYLGREIGLDSDQVIKVHRPADEVFSDAALASFEGKPVTDEHPPELLDPDTAPMYGKGHAQNIRKGAGEWDGFVIADLHVHDGGLIRAIQNGKREISCGYECEYADNGDGTYSQKNIRGNHVAVVDRGRAGKRASILDSDTAKSEQAEKRPERKKMKKNGLFLKLFGQAVKDKSPDEIERMAMDAADALEDGGAVQQAAQPPDARNEPAGKGASMDSAGIKALNEKMDTLLKLMDGQGMETKKTEEDPMDAAIKKLEKAGDDDEDEKEEAKVVPAEGKDAGPAAIDKALAAGILKAMRPAVAAIKDDAQRRAVSDALINCVTAQGGEGDIARIMQAVQNNAQKAADHKPQVGLDAIQKAYDDLNPHRKERK